MRSIGIERRGASAGIGQGLGAEAELRAAPVDQPERRERLEAAADFGQVAQRGEIGRALAQYLFDHPTALLVGRAGIDVYVTPKIFVNLDLKYIDMDTTRAPAEHRDRHTIGAGPHRFDRGGAGIGFRL